MAGSIVVCVKCRLASKTAMWCTDLAVAIDVKNVFSVFCPFLIKNVIFHYPINVDCNYRPIYNYNSLGL